MTQKILVTHPGRHGDLLWALPTARAIARAHEAKVDFATSGAYGKIVDLLQEGAGDYIARAEAFAEWELRETAPITPREIPERLVGEEYDKVYNLGMARWPELPIAEWVLEEAGREYQMLPELRKGFDLEPWIKVEHATPPVPVVVVGWNELWIELKMGITLALAQRFPNLHFHLLFYKDARPREWRRVFPQRVGYHETDSWALRARALGEATVFLGDLGAMWVLVNAMGKRSVICEPAEPRWNPAFWREHPRNFLVRGNDGKPTFDARQVGDALIAAVAEERGERG